MSPIFDWLDLSLIESLYNKYGVPVSICDSRILFHTSLALTTLLALPAVS